MITLICAMFLVTLVGSERPTEEERQTLLAFHNAKRRLVNPPAADMHELVYNRRLERLAYEWAEQCSYIFPPPHYDQYDENPVNIAYSDGLVRNVTAMANKWWNEGYNFNYEKNVCEARMCGYYLQMVWGNTEKIGCAVQRCEKVQRGPQTPCYLLTCAYTPPGRIMNVIPYAKGESCSACPNGTTCIDKLCSKRPAPPSNDITGGTGNTGNIDTTSTSSSIWVREMGTCFMLIVYLLVQ